MSPTVCPTPTLRVLLAAGRVMYSMTPTDYEPSREEYIAATKAALKTLLASKAIIEEMAIAICGKDFWRFTDEPGKGFYRSKARAALEALLKL